MSFDNKQESSDQYLLHIQRGKEERQREPEKQREIGHRLERERAQAKLDEPTKYPLHAACRRGDYEAVIRLTQHETICCLNYFGESPIGLAIQYDYLNIAIWLLEQGANIPSEVNGKPLNEDLIKKLSEKEYAIHKACRRGDYDEVSRLLTPCSFHYCDEPDQYPLSIAVQSGHLHIVTLITTQITPYLKPSISREPLVILRVSLGLALQQPKPHLEIIRHLLECLPSNILYKQALQALLLLTANNPYRYADPSDYLAVFKLLTRYSGGIPDKILPSLREEAVKGNNKDIIALCNDEEKLRSLKPYPKTLIEERALREKTLLQSILTSDANLPIVLIDIIMQYSHNCRFVNTEQTTKSFIDHSKQISDSKSVLGSPTSFFSGNNITTTSTATTSNTPEEIATYTIS